MWILLRGFITSVYGIANKVTLIGKYRPNFISGLHIDNSQWQTKMYTES